MTWFSVALVLMIVSLCISAGTLIYIFTQKKMPGWVFILSIVVNVILVAWALITLLFTFWNMAS